MNDIYQEVAKHTKTLMFKEPFYGLFLISLNKQVDKRIPTLCVEPDNLNIKLSINPDFWSELKDNVKLGVLKHELLHIAFFHLQNFDRFPDKILQNIAADLEINQYIDKEYKGDTWEGLEYDQGIFAHLNLLPKQGLKYYYEKIQQDIKDNPPTKRKGDGDGNGSDGSGGPGPGSDEDNSPEKGDGEGSGGPSPGNDKNGNSQDGSGDNSVADFVESLRESEDGDIHSLWDAIKDMDEAERKLIQKQIDHQLKEVAENLGKRNRGLIPNELSEYIASLYIKEEPVMDWKSYVRRFAGISPKVLTKKTRYKQNRRFSENPALKIKPQKNILVAIDTSGSVGTPDLVEFFQEIYHIHKTGVNITIIECDAMIQQVYEYKGKRQEIEVKGRGGTDFSPVMDYLIENRRKYNSLIYLTDGGAPAPENVPLVPILWVHCSSVEINEDLPGQKIKIQR